MPTAGDTLASAEHRFQCAKLPSGDALLLLSHCLAKPKEFVLAHAELVLSAAQVARWRRLILKRLNGYSVAALTSSKEFYGLTFSVSKHTLVPRPETEILVEHACALLKHTPSARVLDIGTGCGNIIISIAHECGPKLRYYASDVSPQAIRVARANARAQGVRVRLIHSNLAGALPQLRFDLIVANLPYLTAKQCAEFSIKKEPRKALFGGGTDGLGLYKKLTSALPGLLQQTGTALLEIDPGQVKKLEAVLRTKLPHRPICVHADLAGRARVVEIGPQR